MGDAIWVCLHLLSKPEVQVQGRKPHTHIPVRICHRHEQPHQSHASGQCGASSYTTGCERNKQVFNHVERLQHKAWRGRPRLISDSQTCLSLCSRPSGTLHLSTSLVVLRVQETFTHDNLYFVPGKLFEDNIDLLKGYNSKLLPIITSSFFQPPFLMPVLQDRVTVKVENMKKTMNLPHIFEK